jgi:hypothetical protein
MHHSCNVLVFNILLHVSVFQNALIRESDMNMLRWCPVSGYPDHYAVCHNIQLLSFSVFHDIRHHLSMFISDSLMRAF